MIPHPFQPLLCSITGRFRWASGGFLEADLCKEGTNMVAVKTRLSIARRVKAQFKQALAAWLIFKTESKGSHLICGGRSVAHSPCASVAYLHESRHDRPNGKTQPRDACFVLQKYPRAKLWPNYKKQNAWQWEKYTQNVNLVNATTD